MDTTGTKLRDKAIEILDELEKNGDLSESEQTRIVPVDSPAAGSVELLRELMDACSPYLKRKKMTPRPECNELNRVWEKCAEHLEKPNTLNESQGE